MLALLGNVVAAAFCSASPNRLGIPDELLGALVICSSHGEQSLPDDPAPAKPCQICLAVASVTLVVALTTILLALPVSTGAPIGFAAAPAFACALRRGTIGSRAPPLPA